MKKIFKFFAALSAVAFCLASCEKPYEELTPSFPTLKDKTVTINSGESVKVDFSLNDVRGNDVGVKCEFSASEAYSVSSAFSKESGAGIITIVAPESIYKADPFDIKVTFSDQVSGRTSSDKITVKPVVKPLDGLNPSFSAQAVTINSGETLTVDFSLNDVRGNTIEPSCTFASDESYDVKAEMASGGESGKLTITAPALILSDTAFDITVKFTDKTGGRDASAKVNVKPVLVKGLVKLTEAANTFVVAPGAVALFPTVKGKGGEKAAVANVVLAWQDAAGLFVDVPVVKDGEAIVRFAEGKEGNALLSGIDAAGTTIWSWLFWVAKEAPKDVKAGDYTFMDRNIGAMTLDEKSELSVGLAYQYGRKDPIPALQFTKYALRPIYDANGAEVSIAIVKNEAANNLENAIKNPMNFYNNVYVSGAKHGYSWLTTDVTTFGADNLKALWENGGKKTAYDPCPAGYKVSPKAAWDGVKTLTVTEIWDDKYETFDASTIGTNEKYAAGNRKKVQFRGCAYGDLRLTVTGEINSNSTTFSFANCVGKALPTAEVWMAEVDPDYEKNPTSTSYFRGTCVKVNHSGNGNFDDISAIKVNALNTGNKFNLNYALPVRCVKE